ncbi:hypothetical protein U1Q18_040609 [Sarracenia purpurea var. burkii]
MSESVLFEYPHTVDMISDTNGEGKEAVRESVVGRGTNVVSKDAVAVGFDISPPNQSRPFRIGKYEDEQCPVGAVTMGDRPWGASSSVKAMKNCKQARNRLGDFCYGSRDRTNRSSKNNFGVLANLDYDEIFPSLSGANPKAPIKERNIVVNESRGPTISSEPVRDYDCAEEGRRLERLTMVALKRAKTGRSPLSQEEVNHLESWLARYRASNDQTNQIFQSVASNMLGVSAPLTDQVDPAPTIQVSAILEKPREIEEGHSKDGRPRALPSDEPPTSEADDGGDSGSGSDGSKSEVSEQEGEGETSVLDVSPHPKLVDRNGEMKDGEGGNEERDTDSEAYALVEPNGRVAVSKKDEPNDEQDIITESCGNKDLYSPVDFYQVNRLEIDSISSDICCVDVKLLETSSSASKDLPTGHMGGVLSHAHQVLDENPLSDFAAETENARCARPVEGFAGNVDHVQGKGKPLENGSEREGYVMHGVCSQAYAPHVFEKYPVPGPEAQNKQVPVGEAEQDFGGPSAHLDEGLVAEEPGIAYIPVVEAGMKSWANVVATGK